VEPRHLGQDDPALGKESFPGEATADGQKPRGIAHFKNFRYRGPFWGDGYALVDEGG
jgi:hypothetical protein